MTYYGDEPAAASLDEQPTDDHMTVDPLEQAEIDQPDDGSNIALKAQARCTR
jgi:hypothetical protein